MNIFHMFCIDQITLFQMLIYLYCIQSSLIKILCLVCLFLVDKMFFYLNLSNYIFISQNVCTCCVCVYCMCVCACVGVVCMCCVCLCSLRVYCVHVHACACIVHVCVWARLCVCMCVLHACVCVHAVWSSKLSWMNSNILCWMKL